MGLKRAKRVQCCKPSQVVDHVFAVDGGYRRRLPALQLTADDIVCSLSLAQVRERGQRGGAGTGDVDLGSLFAIDRDRGDGVRTCEGEGRKDAGVEHDVGIVQRKDQELQVCFKDILIFVVPGRYVLLDLLQALKNVDGRLLVSLRGIPEICERALKLEGGVVVVDETRRHRVVEGDACQAFDRG